MVVRYAIVDDFYKNKSFAINVSFLSLQQQTSPLKTAANSASAHHSRIQILKANVLLNRSYVCLCLNDPTTALDCAQSLLALSSSPSSPSETGKLLSSSGFLIQPDEKQGFLKYIFIGKSGYHTLVTVLFARLDEI